ncbi:MAG: DUF4254 domain-containing protein [Chloroflexota bacterium]|nr:DUF4254 domain-containing protein [Chloroflexota bacterium]
MVARALPGSGMQQVIQRCVAGEQVPLHSEHAIDNLVDRICYVNFRQWQLEDAIRDPEINAEQAFVLIKQIQASNAERTRMMELIDRYYVNQRTHQLAAGNATTKDGFPACPSAGDDLDGTGAVEFHETLGQLVDILSILYVRRYHTAQLMAQGFEYHPGNGYRMEEAIDAIDRQIALCERSFLHLRDLFLAGRVALPPLSHFKLYATATERRLIESTSKAPRD